MAVITITISQSPIELVAGIPKAIYVSTNIPSTIFYTLGGADIPDPTHDSDIVVSGLNLPTDIPSVYFKAFATDGTNTSPIITQIYQNTTFSKLRRPRDKVIGLDNSVINQDRGIFGSNSPNPNTIFGNTGGITVDDPTIIGIPDGYNGTATGTPASFTDLPLIDYKFTYSTTDRLGQTGKGIGTLPAQIKIYVPPPPPEESDTSSKLFNPKALLIIQDGTKPSENPDISLINRPYFSLTNANTSDGVDYTTTAFEGSNITGSFLRQFYNPRDQTITYYYFDSKALRWIISKEPYTPTKLNLYNYSTMVFPLKHGPGSRFVYESQVFRRRYLP
jgi:hypothetical protein